MLHRFGKRKMSQAEAQGSAQREAELLRLKVAQLQEQLDEEKSAKRRAQYEKVGLGRWFTATFATVILICAAATSLAWVIRLEICVREGVSYGSFYYADFTFKSTAVRTLLTTVFRYDLRERLLISFLNSLFINTTEEYY